MSVRPSVRLSVCPILASMLTLLLLIIMTRRGRRMFQPFCLKADTLVLMHVNNAYGIVFGAQVLDHVMVGIEGITKERGHHLIRER